eukprot:SAG31_NODE_1201_length_9418_cov_3.410881_10_plen_328_part_00
MPSTLFLIFISRTFGHAIDRCQIVLTFFTAIILMVPLILLVTLLPLSGLFRIIYSLDPVCRACFDGYKCPALSPPESVWASTCINSTTNAYLIDNFTAPGRLDHNVSVLPDGCCFRSCEAAGCSTRQSEPMPLITDNGASLDTTGLQCGCLLRSFFFAYFRAAFFEESLKFAAVSSIYTKAWVSDPRALVLYAATAAAGFAAAENMEYLGRAYLSAQTESPDLGSLDGGTKAMILGAIVRAILAIPLHVGCGLIIGARLGQDRFMGRVPGIPDRGAIGVWLHAICWPVFFHGSYDFVLMGGSGYLVQPSEFYRCVSLAELCRLLGLP